MSRACRVLCLAVDATGFSHEKIIRIRDCRGNEHQLLYSAHAITADGRFAEAVLAEEGHDTSVVYFSSYEYLSIRVPSCDVLVAKAHWVPLVPPPATRIRPATIIAALEGRGKDGWGRYLSPDRSIGFARDWPRYRARVFATRDLQDDPCYRGVLREFCPNEGWLLITCCNYTSCEIAKRELVKTVKERLNSGRTSCDPDV